MFHPITILALRSTSSRWRQPKPKLFFASPKIHGRHSFNQRETLRGMIHQLQAQILPSFNLSLASHIPHEKFINKRNQRERILLSDRLSFSLWHTLRSASTPRTSSPYIPTSGGSPLPLHLPIRRGHHGRFRFLSYGIRAVFH